MTAILEPTMSLAPSFRAWQRRTLEAGLLPVIAIGGTRGKSTVVRMLDAIFAAAHLRTATWTNLGIEVRGRKQQGELAAWGTTMQRLAAGTIDVAIQELHWSTINAVGLPAASYPLVALTNIWPDESDDELTDLKLAVTGAERLSAAVSSAGYIAGCCDDMRLADVQALPNSRLILSARSSTHPHLLHHLRNGLHGVWTDDDRNVVVGEGSGTKPLMASAAIGGTAQGRAFFQTSNAMVAISLALATGIDRESIVQGLATFEAQPDVLPASFNVHEGVDITALVNRMESPSIARSLMRAVNPQLRRRQLTVLGDLDGMTLEQAHELGKHIGKTHGAVLIHSQSDTQLVQSLRNGIATDNFPPLFISLPTERRALNRAIATAQANDVIVVFTTDDGRTANRAIARMLADQSATE